MSKKTAPILFSLVLLVLTGCTGNTSSSSPEQSNNTGSSTTSVSSTPSPRTTPAPTETTSITPTASASPKEKSPTYATPTQQISQHPTASTPGNLESPTVKATWCNPQPDPNNPTYAGDCPATPSPNYPAPVINNGQEAAEHVLKNKWDNNPDIQTNVWSESYTPSGYPQQFIIESVSISMEKQGGTGTLEYDIVDPWGNIFRTEASLLPR